MTNSNKNLPTVQGVGIVGYGQYSPFLGKTMTKHYRKWISMLERSHSVSYKQDNIEYVDVTCVPEWHLFQTFAEWCDVQIGFNNEGWHLDKDILVKGNKIYGPDFCAFVPAELNSLLNTRSRARSDSGTVGVLRTKYGRFTASCKMGGSHAVYLGTYSTIEEAFLVYKETKEQYIKQRAFYWKDQIDERVYHALMNRTVDVDD